jgi:hypothetical protein
MPDKQHSGGSDFQIKWQRKVFNVNARRVEQEAICSLVNVCYHVHRVKKESREFHDVIHSVLRGSLTELSLHLKTMPRGKEYRQRKGQCKNENSVHSQSIGGGRQAGNSLENIIFHWQMERISTTPPSTRSALVLRKQMRIPSNHLGPRSSELMKGLKGVLDSPRMTVYRP